MPMFTYPQLLIPTAILTFFTYKQTFEAFTKIRCINKKDIAYSFLKRPDRKRQTRKENTITMVRKRCTNCFTLQESEVFDIQCLFFMGLHSKPWKSRWTNSRHQQYGKGCKEQISTFLKRSPYSHKQLISLHCIRTSEVCFSWFLIHLDNIKIKYAVINPQLFKHKTRLKQLNTSYE